ncbi:hypothetical protein BLI708_04220 [Bifidobacterium imperatoris]|uniref:Uncharacterized protein n=1 Tax=Bifidobacterium imperatoris TaxID=2020965 RepID=A0A2N5ITR3_9BIFI|nr:hypothetical protein [Bifidobacterium imperatoris]PLS25356.1 hypothetical protein Tam1G_0558 [Bifidobacterium imperatoris]QSY58485.1 hypothetical protein BLI708_04220 [Bifidobacterium imperatoris]
MTVDLNRDAIARVAALPEVEQAAEAGASLIALWPLTQAMHMDNDAKYAENLQVRVTRAFARVLTGEDVTVPDAEFVYEGADAIPGRPQDIVDTLLAANDAYDTMLDYSETGNAALVFTAAEALGVEWNVATQTAIRNIIAAAESHVQVDAAAEGEGAADAAAVASRFAAALIVCDALLGAVAAGTASAGAGELDDAVARRIAAQSLPILLYVNELREQCSIPRICLTDDKIIALVKARAAASAGETLEVTAKLIAPLAEAEWNKHHEDVLWNPAEAKKKAKEEDEKRNKEALAAKFAHVKNDNKETVEL